MLTLIIQVPVTRMTDVSLARTRGAQFIHGYACRTITLVANRVCAGPLQAQQPWSSLLCQESVLPNITARHSLATPRYGCKDCVLYYQCTCAAPSATMHSHDLFF